MFTNAFVQQNKEKEIEFQHLLTFDPQTSLKDILEFHEQLNCHFKKESLGILE